MTKNTNDTTATKIAAICDERAKAKPQQQEKWDIEKSFLASEGVANLFDAQKFNVAELKGMAIYAVQKVRKLARFMAGERNNVDPATMAILKAAQNLAKHEVAFTPILQQAALAKGLEVPSGTPVGKLGGRGNYTKGTAMSQSGTTREALQAMGLAEVKPVDGVKNTLVVNMEHKAVKTLLGIDDGAKK